MAEVVFQPQQPFVVDSFKNCEGLGRIAIMEGATVVMLGKVIDAVADDGKPPEDPKAAKKEGGPAPAKGTPQPAGAKKEGGAAPAKGTPQPAGAAAKPAGQPAAKSAAPAAAKPPPKKT